MYLNANNRWLQLSSATNSWPAGPNGNAVRTGSQYNDLYFSGTAETLAGLGGDDTYYLFSNAPTVLEGFGQGIDTIISHVWGTVTLSNNVENLILDMIGATGGIGNSLDNIIIAGPHAATLWGRGGDDVLVSGKGGDVFKIVAGEGSDAIVGFQHGWDAISLNGYGIKSFAQILSLATQTSDDVVIQLSSTETLVLRDIDLGNLSASDFNFLDHMDVQSGNVHMTRAAQVHFSNGWFVLNNTWGSGALTLGVDYQFESTFSSADMTSGTTFNWSYPVSANFSTPILAYAQVSFGHTPHGLSPNPYATPGVFPLSLERVVDIELNHDFSINGNVSGFNVAYDVWFTDRPYGGRDDVTTELMIWVHQGSVQPFGALVGTYTGAGFSANIYNTGDYVAVVFNEDYLKGTIDLGDLIEHLIDLGIMDRSEYLASIDLGAEVVSGSGGYTINDLDFSITRTGENGGTEIVSVDGSKTTFTDVPDAPIPEVPVIDTPDVPVIPTPEVPVAPTPELPTEPVPEVPGVPAPEVPAEPTPETPVTPTPDVPDEPLPEILPEPEPEVSENDRPVTTVVIADLEVGEDTTFALSGADAGKFTISDTGELTFKAAPDFEAPTDVNKDNSYTVTAKIIEDGKVVESQALAIKVNNINEAPVITSNGGVAAADIEVAENGKTVMTVKVSDPDAGATKTFALSGSDASKFTISSSGVLAFKTAPNYEGPTDANANNYYSVTVTAKDNGGLTDSQKLSIRVLDANEAPTITSNGGGAEATINVAENSTKVTTVKVSDVDADATKTFTLSGSDADKFTISSSGALAFKSAPDFEAPTDNNKNNVYSIIVKSTDNGGLSDSQKLIVNVTDVAETKTGTNLADKMMGGAGSDKLVGSFGNDTLNGKAGNDFLIGSMGADKLTGGSGADHFIFNATAHSTTTASGRDTIFDFSRSEGDKIDLRGIDARTDMANDQAFKFIGSSDFTKVAGQLRFDKHGSDTFVSGDINGDGKADFMIHFDDALSLQSSDFLL